MDPFSYGLPRELQQEVLRSVDEKLEEYNARLTSAGKVNRRSIAELTQKKQELEGVRKTLKNIKRTGPDLPLQTHIQEVEARILSLEQKPKTRTSVSRQLTELKAQAAGLRLLQARSASVTPQSGTESSGSSSGASSSPEASVLSELTEKLKSRNALPQARKITKPLPPKSEKVNRTSLGELGSDVYSEVTEQEEPTSPKSPKLSERSVVRRPTPPSTPPSPPPKRRDSYDEFMAFARRRGSIQSLVDPELRDTVELGKSYINQESPISKRVQTLRNVSARGSIDDELSAMNPSQLVLFARELNRQIVDAKEDLALIDAEKKEIAEEAAKSTGSSLSKSVEARMKALSAEAAHVKAIIDTNTMLIEKVANLIIKNDRPEDILNHCNKIFPGGASAFFEAICKIRPKIAFDVQNYRIRYIRSLVVQARNLTQLEPQQSAALLKSLTQAERELQELSNNGTYSKLKAVVDSTLSAVSEIKEKLVGIKVENANIQLIAVLRGDLVGAFGKVSAEKKSEALSLLEQQRDLLILGSDTVLGSTELVTLFRDALTNARSQMERAKVISFIEEWCAHNNGAKGFEKVRQFIDDLNPPLVTRQEKAILTKALEPPARSEPARLQSGTVRFIELMDRIAKGKIRAKSEEYESAVKSVAEDLGRLLGRYYCLHTDDTLYKTKWAKPSTEEQIYAQQFNKMQAFLVDCLFLHEPAKERAEMLKFYADVGARCIERGDFATAFVLRSVLSDSNTMRMGYALENAAKSSTSAQKANLKELETVCDSKDNFKELRKRLAERTWVNSIPYLGLLATDLTFFTDSARFPKFSTEAETVNYEGLQKAKEWITNYKAGQERVRDELQPNVPLYSNLPDALDTFTPRPQELEDTLTRWRSPTVGIEKPRQK